MMTEERFKENQLIYYASGNRGIYKINIGRTVRHPTKDSLAVISDQWEFAQVIDECWQESPQLAAKYLIDKLTFQFEFDITPLKDIANGR
jgi:hypothetical protein